MGERLLKLSERDVFDAWLSDLSRVGYSPPILPRPSRHASSSSAAASSVSTFHYDRAIPAPPLDCYTSTPETNNATAFIVGVFDTRVTVITLTRVYTAYRRRYRLVVFCFPRPARVTPASYPFSYVMVDGSSGGVDCLEAVLRVGYPRVSGYAYAPIAFVHGRRRPLQGRHALVIRQSDYCSTSCGELLRSPAHSDLSSSLSSHLRVKVDRCLKNGSIG